MIKLPVFKKKKCSYLHKGFVLVSVLKGLFLSLSEGKNYKIAVPMTSPESPNVIGTNHTCLSKPCFTEILLSVQ